MKLHVPFLALSLLFITGINAQDIPSADQVLAEGSKVAAKEKKNVMIIFHASWCGWCKKMDKAMNEPEMKPLFEKNYVIRHLTVYESPGKEKLENPGALDLLKKYKGADMGIPYFLVFSPDGKMLADSQIKPGENVGCPADDNEVEFFTAALKKTSRLSDSQLKEIGERFKKNK